jgi:hypothetical protein
MLGVHRRDELCTQHTGVCRPLRSCTQVGRSGLYFGERSSVPPLGLNWVAGLQTRLLRAHANEHAKVAGGVAEPGARRGLQLVGTTAAGAAYCCSVRWVVAFAFGTCCASATDLWRRHGSDPANAGSNLIQRID